MTMIKTVINGSRTTLDITGTIVTMGDPSSSIYKDVFESLSKISKSTFDTDVFKKPIVVSIIPSLWATQPSLIEEVLNEITKDKTIIHQILNAKGNPFVKHIMSTLNYVAEFNPMIARGDGVRIDSQCGFHPREKEKNTVYDTTISCVVLDKSRQAEDARLLNIELDSKTGVFRYDRNRLTTTSPALQLTFTIPPMTDELIEAMNISHVKPDREVYGTYLDVDEDGNEVTKLMTRSGNRQPIQKNVAGVFTLTFHKEDGGINYEEHLVYHGDRVYLMNDLGNTVDHIK